jgi:hypothetical protein
MTVVAQVHMCLPYPLPSHLPACGCQGSRSLAVPAPHACACLCTLSGPLFIQAPRFTRWYGWSSIKSDDEDNFSKRPRVAVTSLLLSGGPRSARAAGVGRSHKWNWGHFLPVVLIMLPHERLHLLEGTPPAVALPNHMLHRPGRKVDLAQAQVHRNF